MVGSSHEALHRIFQKDPTEEEATPTSWPSGPSVRSTRPARPSSSTPPSRRSGRRPAAGAGVQPSTRTGAPARYARIPSTACP